LTSQRLVININLKNMPNVSGKVRKIQKTRNTYYITIPHEVMDNLSWKERQKVVVKKSGSKIVIEDWKK